MIPQIAHTNGKVHRSTQRYSLARLDAEALAKLWPTRIRPGLVKVKQKDPHSGEWQPEHVRAALDRGHLGHMFCECHLIVPVSDTTPVGFVILRLYPDEYLNVALSLWVWITYCTDPDALVPVMGLVEKRAREIGVRYVAGSTSRTSWLRRLRRHGYELDRMTIRKEIV